MGKKFLFLFASANLLLASFYLDTWDNGNTASRMLAVYYAVNEGTFCIDKRHEKTVDKSFISGHYYSDKAPLPALAIVPFYKLLRLSGYDENGEGKAIYILGSLICGVIPFVIILVLIYNEINKTAAPVHPVFLATLPFYGSFIFIYAGSFYNHVFSSLFLLLSYIHLGKKNYFLSGLFGGLGFLSEYVIFVVLAIWGIQTLLNEKKLKPGILFGLGLLPAIAAIMIYNFIFTGDPFSMLYKYHSFEALHSGYGFSHPTPESLWGLTFSPYRGLFFYAPFLFTALFLLLKKLFRAGGRELVKKLPGSYLFSCTLVSILVISSYFGWWGGWAYGPRLITFTAVLLLYEGILLMRDERFPKIIFWLPVLTGLILAFADKFTVLYNIPSEVNHPFAEIIFPGLVSFNLNPNNLLTMLAGIPPLTAALAWLILFGSILSAFAKWT